MLIPDWTGILRVIIFTLISMQVLLNNKPAYKLNAKRKINLEQGGKANRYDLEGILMWIPHSVCKYNEKEETILIYEWWYNKYLKNIDC